MLLNRDSKNIIFLVIDSLRADRVGFGDNSASLTPFLNQLAQKSLVYKNVFSNGNNTEFALPGLFSSSHLLDDGGYFSGIAQRGNTLAGTLKKNGYRTAAFHPLYVRSTSGGYTRGFHDFFHLFDINLFLKEINNTVPWYQKMFSDGLMTEVECVDVLIQYFDIYFKEAISYCHTWLSYSDNPCIPKSLIFKHYEFDAIRDEFEEEFKYYSRDKYLYVSRVVRGERVGFDHKTGLLCGEPRSFIDIINRAVRGRIKRSPVGVAEIKFRTILARNFFWIWHLSSSYKSAKQAFADALYRVLKGQQHQVKYLSAGYILQTFKNWLDSNSSDSPFYAYMHLVDGHELNHFSFDLAGQEKKKKYELATFRKSLSQIKHNRRTYRGNILYDTAISYVDSVVKDLFQFLEKKGLLNSSIIVITADHGHAYPNVPIRDGVSQQEHFFDDLSHIPLIISGSEMPSGQYENLVSSLDIGPTILDFAGIPAPNSFRGISVKPGACLQRDHVINENQGRGPCDIERKPLRICVRTKNYKLVYECPTGLSADRGIITEIYDLVSDQKEYENLAGDLAAVESVESLLEIAKERVKTIRGYVASDPDPLHP